MYHHLAFLEPRVVLSKRKPPLVISTIKRLIIECNPGLGWLRLCPNATDLGVKCLLRYQNGRLCHLALRLSQLTASGLSTMIQTLSHECFVDLEDDEDWNTSFPRLKRSSCLNLAYGGRSYLKTLITQGKSVAVRRRSTRLIASKSPCFSVLSMQLNSNGSLHSTENHM